MAGAGTAAAFLVVAFMAFMAGIVTTGDELAERLGYRKHQNNCGHLHVQVRCVCFVLDVNNHLRTISTDSFTRGRPGRGTFGST